MAGRAGPSLAAPDPGRAPGPDEAHGGGCEWLTPGGGGWITHRSCRIRSEVCGDWLLAAPAKLAKNASGKPGSQPASPSAPPLLVSHSPLAHSNHRPRERERERERLPERHHRHARPAFFKLCIYLPNCAAEAAPSPTAAAAAAVAAFFPFAATVAASRHFLPHQPALSQCLCCCFYFSHPLLLTRFSSSLTDGALDQTPGCFSSSVHPDPGPLSAIHFSLDYCCLPDPAPARLNNFPSLSSSPPITPSTRLLPCSLGPSGRWMLTRWRTGGTPFLSGRSFTRPELLLWPRNTQSSDLAESGRTEPGKAPSISRYRIYPSRSDDTLVDSPCYAIDHFPIPTTGNNSCSSIPIPFDRQLPCDIR